MHKLQVVINNKDGALQYDQLHVAPASWAEMTREHLLIWAGTMGSNIKTINALPVLTALLYKIPKKYFICIKRSEITKIYQSVAFLLKRNRLSLWLLPAIWHRFFKYYGLKTCSEMSPSRSFD